MHSTNPLLDQIWSGARNGLTALRAILDITDDTHLRNEIYRQETEYQNVLREAENQMAALDQRPGGTACMVRACTWAGMRMNTMADKSTPHLLGLVIQGNTMGVIEMTKARADFPEADQNAHALAARLIALQQDNIERSLALLREAEALAPA